MGGRGVCLFVLVCCGGASWLGLRWWGQAVGSKRGWARLVCVCVCLVANWVAGWGLGALIYREGKKTNARAPGAGAAWLAHGPRRRGGKGTRGRDRLGGHVRWRDEFFLGKERRKMGDGFGKGRDCCTPGWGVERSLRRGWGQFADFNRQGHGVKGRAAQRGGRHRECGRQRRAGSRAVSSGH